MVKLKIIATCLLFAALLSACNLGQSGTVGTPVLVATPTQSVFITPGTLQPTTIPPTEPPLPTKAVTKAATATFPPVITATKPAATATTQPPAATATATSSTTKTNGLKISSFNMIDSNTGWAIGKNLPATDDLILRSTDGGKNWKKITPPESGLAGKTAVAFFLDGARAWVNYAAQPAGGSPPTQFTVWRTVDGGANWKSTVVSLAGLTMENFSTVQIAFQDANNGWLMSILGAGMNHTYISVYKTSDGGANWKEIISPDKNNISMSCSKTGVWFRDAVHGFVAGGCYGVVKGLYFYRSGDSGATWTPVTLPAPPGLADAFTNENNACNTEALRFFDANKGYVVVSCTNANTNKSYRWIYITKDGGSSWGTSTMPRQFGEVFFLNIDTAWFLGQTATDNFANVNVYKSSDTGKNWNKISGTNWGGTLDFIDSKNGWGIAKSASETAFVHTTDGGLTYQVITPQILP